MVFMFMFMNFFASAVLTFLMVAIVAQASSIEGAVICHEGDPLDPTSLSVNSYVSMIFILRFGYVVLRARCNSVRSVTYMSRGWISLTAFTSASFSPFTCSSSLKRSLVRECIGIERR